MEELKRNVTKEVEKEVKSGRKTISFQRKRGERPTSATVAPETNHDSSVSLRGTVRSWTGFADIAKNEEVEAGTQSSLRRVRDNAEFLSW